MLSSLWTPHRWLKSHYLNCIEIATNTNKFKPTFNVTMVCLYKQW